MPFRTAIKWIHRLVTVVLLVLVAGFLWLNNPNDARDHDELQRAYKLSDSVWLYITVNNQGGATVPTFYRYYLSQKLPGEDGDIIRQLAAQSPVLEGTGSITEAHVEKNGLVSIAYSGNVFSVREDVSELRLTIKP